MQTDHWSTRTLDFLNPHLQDARQTVRIATGYFSIQGYDLIRRYLASKRTYILVGFDESAQGVLRQHLLTAIRDDLSRWDAENRRVAVLELVRKLREGELRILDAAPGGHTEARLRHGDHAKVYLMDDRVALVGSVNLSASGLLANGEGMATVTDPERVAYWVRRFEDFWHAPDTQDITQELIALLEAWLALATPYDIYLRTLLALITLRKVEPPRANYKMPVRYQQVIIERVLRQLTAHRGAMLVASTGLGKTVMATHTALWLVQRGLIHNVVVFAPRAIHREWERQLTLAGIAHQVQTRELLDRPAPKRQRVSSRSAQLDETLASIDERYLIIVDESQYFRHRTRAKDGDPRHSFRRLLPVVAQRKPFVLLLTATPYSRGVADVNSQLALLPHTADPDYRLPSGQFAIPGMIDEHLQPRAWRVSEGEGYFEEFTDLPVTTVISTSHIARDFATHTADGDFIDFHGKRRWIPQISGHRISTPLPEEASMRAALVTGVFQHTPVRYRSRDRGGVTRVNVQQQAELAWTSSPAALCDVIERTIQDSYKADFTSPKEQRERVPSPIRERLMALPAAQDAKFQALCRLLRQAQQTGQKTLIFAERHATVVYLAEQLPLAIPGLRVAATSYRDAQGKYGLRSYEDEVLDLIYGFAPVANEDNLRTRRNQPAPLDVLVVTDAFSAGVNLQDASLAIHYDLAWTPDILGQRSGRILRFWHEPRRVDLYFFLSSYASTPEGSTLSAMVEARLARLTERDQGARRFSGLPGVPERDSVRYERLGDLAGVGEEYLGLADIGEIGEFDAISPLLRHSGVLQKERVRAEALGDDLTSALVYNGSEPLVYVLLRHPDGYSWYVVNANSMSSMQTV